MRATQRTLAVLILLVLAGIPAVGTACAALCDPDTARVRQAAGAPRHDAPAACHEPADPTGVRMDGAAKHGCTTHDRGIRELPATVAGSGSAALTLVLTVAQAVLPPTPHVPLPSSTHSAPSSPPGSDLPAHAPLVLRV